MPITYIMLQSAIVSNSNGVNSNLETQGNYQENASFKLQRSKF